MGKKPVEEKKKKKKTNNSSYKSSKKKKGRPSLLDLQKRNLRLQKHQQIADQNPNPNPNPYARFQIPSSARRNRNPDLRRSPERDSDEEEEDEEEDDDEEEEDGISRRRKEKKLKLVLHLPHSDAKAESKNSSFKATEVPQGEKSDFGPTTSLPDKKLLEFILDRLQKKDTYGVFSEPVDPEELPDYHGIIQHPMDFETVRNRLSSGAYSTLEHFEKDVFLISSNAMRYNSPDTIYFRQARSIHELAMKSFENLRQESDDNDPDPEPKIVRRGRPPGTGKNNVLRPVGKPPAEQAGSEFSPEASFANASNGNLSSSPMNDFLRGASGFHKPCVADASAKALHCSPISDTYSLRSQLKSERSEDHSVAGNVCKWPLKSGKKLSVKDENGRDTNKQLQLSMSELPMLTGSATERKILVPVGFHVEFAYARSLARFAANLGPIGWKLAAKRIEKVIPPGTKFGPGWIGESNSPRLFLTPAFHTSSAHSSVVLTATASRSDQCTERKADIPSSEVAEQECHLNEAKFSSQIHPIAKSQPPANGFKANMHQPRKFIL